MAQFKIFIDSTGDLPKDLRDEYDIDYCPMIVTVDEKEIVASLDYDQGYTLKQFYDVMREGRRIFTSQVPDQVFVEKFTAALEAGEDILYIACSSKLSASVLAGEKVAQKLREEYPNRKIVVFDSKIACYGQGEMAICASKFRKEGKSLDEVVAWLNANIFKFNQFATVDSLTYLKRAGRVSKTSPSRKSKAPRPRSFMAPRPSSKRVKTSRARPSTSATPTPSKPLNSSVTKSLSSPPAPPSTSAPSARSSAPRPARAPSAATSSAKKSPRTANKAFLGFEADGMKGTIRNGNINWLYLCGDGGKWL